jgi:hypothetical protein
MSILHQVFGGQMEKMILAIGKFLQPLEELSKTFLEWQVEQFISQKLLLKLNLQIVEHGLSCKILSLTYCMEGK